MGMVACAGRRFRARRDLFGVKYPLWFGSWLVFTVYLGACGSIRFPAGPSQADAGLTPDVGPADPDTGMVVPDVDGGAECTPVPEPPQFPSEWPYERSAAGYETNFFDIVVGNQPRPSLTCSNGNCHARNVNPPYLPTIAELADATLLNEGIDALWAVMSVAGTVGDTRLRSAHLPGGEAAGQYVYSTMERMVLSTVEMKTLECRWRSTYLARPDGGGGCPDAAVVGGSGGQDGGLDDGGVSMPAQCECVLSVRDLDHCVSP
jgi:hypothetical protein